MIVHVAQKPSNDVLQWKPLKVIVFKQTGYSGSDSSSDEDEEGEGASYRRV